MRAQRRYIAFAIAATTAAVVGFPLSAAGVEGAALGRRYNDKLDSRLSASALASATRSLGYTGSASTNGRDATEAWNDTRGAAVIGYFGHANAGLFQVDEGATNNSDQFISAGRETDLVSGNANRRRWSEFLPFADVDDLRLAVLAGCYTANDDDIFGQFSDMGAQRGIDAVVGFAGLVYYPATASGTAIGETNYSGNYFWSRFSAYAKNGDTVATALSKARTDIVAKEGSAQGWGAYRIGGSVSTPGSTRIKPSTAGQAATSRPFGLEPFTLTDLTVTSSAPGTSAIGDTTERSTTEGVTFRTLKDGTLLDLHAPASTLGELALGLSKAREAAIAFARPHVGDLSDHVLVEEELTAHAEGESIAQFTWRRTAADSVPGGSAVTVEIDRRTGAVTYFSSVHDGAAGVPSAGGTLSSTEAVARVAELVDTSDARITTERDVWGVPRITVTVDRGIRDLLPDVDRIVVDARTGDVIAATTA